MRRLLAIISLAAAAAAVVPPASATEVEGFTLSDSQKTVKKEYGPIPVQNPSGTLGDPTLSDCRDLPSHALIPIELDFANDFGHLGEFAVTWPAHEANDIDIYFFNEAGDVIADSASADHPETFRVGNPENGLYYLCVANFSGANAGFTVDAGIRFLTLYTRPPAASDSPPPARSEETPRPRTTPQPGVSAPKPAPATQEPVATPGPDGPFADRGLVTVAGSKQAAPDEGGRSIAQMVFLGLTGLIAAGGITLVALRIRRDTR